MRRTACITPGCFIILSAGIASAQQPTARELFYAAAPAQAKPTAPAKPVVKAKPAPAEPRPETASAPPRSSTPTAVPVEAAYPGGSPGGPPHTGPITEGATLPGGAHVVSAAAQHGPPIGLRYTIMRLVNGRSIETSPDYVFHAGDHLQLNVQVNTPGYLYVVNQGSSGTWAPIFPSPEVAKGDNRVDGFHTYTLPTPEYQISFDHQPGTENLTIVFSRQPVPDFEDLIYSLQDRKPAGQQPADKQMVALANVHIDDATLGRLRDASSRDLIVEHVDTNTPPDAAPTADKRETAVYVVNPSGASNSRLIADLHLVHK